MLVKQLNWKRNFPIGLQKLRGKRQGQEKPFICFQQDINPSPNPSLNAEDTIGRSVSPELNLLPISVLVFLYTGTLRLICLARKPIANRLFHRPTMMHCSVFSWALWSWLFAPGHMYQHLYLPGLTFYPSHYSIRSINCGYCISSPLTVHHFISTWLTWSISPKYSFSRLTPCSLFVHKRTDSGT